jgi:hypothetical protein
MDNLNLRQYLSKNRFMVETYKISNLRLSYSDFWLSFKFLEYNSLLDEIREDYKIISKNINKIQRDRDDLKDAFLEDAITPEIY